ncbi:MAG: hypothetical protein C0624_08135 [Desulfuromonas sp.]|nr:MAG: hypothetical protein C0624_08135 [Desulfuromonas sp.]
MAEQPKSKAELAIENLMHQLEPGTPRFEVLESAKRFKSSWVELGERLIAVNANKLYREWGYITFEEYCSKEVRIKKPTALKLTRAYRFLEKEEPDLLTKREELRPLPDYRSVDLLCKAQEEGLAEEPYQDLRKAVLEEERSHPTILKRYRDVSPPPPADELEKAALKRALSATRQLEAALGELPELPERLQPTLPALRVFLEEAQARAAA